MPILTPAALISAGLAAAGATAGGIGSAVNRRKAMEEENRNYQNAKDYLNSMYYRDPLSTVGNRSLLKQTRENYADGLDALNNRMVAGGATMENALAARQANNENLDKVYSQLLMGEDARRDRLAAQRMQLDSQHSAAVQNGYRQAAQDWQAWGSQMANAALSYGSASLLGGGEAGEVGKWGSISDADVVGGMGVAAKGLVNADMMQPIIGSAPNLNEPKFVTTPNLGGLRGVNK